MKDKTCNRQIRTDMNKEQNKQNKTQLLKYDYIDVCKKACKSPKEKKIIIFVL